MFDEAGFTGKRTGFGFKNVSFGNIIFVSGAVLLGSMGIGIANLAIETTSTRLTLDTL
jgi:hypothetical protein